MADRFPSLEDFDSGAQTEIKDTLADIPADDLIAREKALLGADADLFATTVDDTVFATSSGSHFKEIENAQSTFESQFPDLSSPAADVSGLPKSDPLTGPSLNFNSGFHSQAEDEEEPQVIKEWRERRTEQLAKRAQLFATQHEKTIKEAQQNIDDFYENYNAKKAKGIGQTRREAEQFLASQEDTVSGGTSWVRIARLVDVSGKGVHGGAAGSGKERYREMLTSLRIDDKAPAALGY